MYYRVMNSYNDYINLLYKRQQTIYLHIIPFISGQKIFLSNKRDPTLFRAFSKHFTNELEL